MSQASSFNAAVLLAAIDTYIEAKIESRFAQEELASPLPQASAGDAKSVRDKRTKRSLDAFAAEQQAQRALREALSKVV